MSAICKHCHTRLPGDPLQCGICGATLRKPRLNAAGKVLIFLILIGLVTTLYACGDLIYQVFGEPGISPHLACAKIAAWTAGFFVYMKVIGLFEGFARNS